MGTDPQAVLKETPTNFTFVPASGVDGQAIVDINGDTVASGDAAAVNEGNAAFIYSTDSACA